MSKAHLLLERLRRAALLVLLLCAAGMGESLAQEPHWTFSTVTYDNYVALQSVIVLDGETIQNMNYELGAFDSNGECRGSYFPPMSMTIGGNTIVFYMLAVWGATGHQITFKVYDHETETELPLVCNTTYTWDGEDYGNAISPYEISFTTLTEITQTAQFVPGWNWWSTYIEQDGIDGLTMLESGLGSNGAVIKTQCDGYAINIPNVGWCGNLQGLNNELTYMIHTEGNCSVEMTGYEANPSEHPITLYPGWNWIGYPNQGAQSVASAFINITPANGDQVRSQTSFSSYLSSLHMWIGALNTLTPGMGLLYKSNNSAVVTLYYPEVMRGEEQLRDITDNNHWMPNMHQYSDNMIFTGVVSLDGEELQSEQYEVGAFVGDECRGSARPLYVEALDQYVVFLTIAGGNDNTGDEVTFKLYDYENDVEFTTDQTVSFEVNGVVGLPFDDAYEFGFSSIVDITCTVYPNEFAGTITGTGSYTMGDTCTLTATANTGYHFVSWEYDGEVVSTDTTYTFTVTEAANYVANFELNSYAITATANPETGGTVTGSGTYNHFSTCTLTATASTGYHFVNWTLVGEVVSDSPTYSFEVTSAADYVANFELNSYAITATANPEAGGTVTGAGTYDHFSTCTLTATASTGYHFVSWTHAGEVVSNSPTYSFEVTEAADYVANFELNVYEISASVNLEEAFWYFNVSVFSQNNDYQDAWDGSAISVEYGSEFIIFAGIEWEWYENGYRFINWTKDGEVVSEDQEFLFTVTESAHYVANFERIVFDITLNTEPAEGGDAWVDGFFQLGEECYLTAVAYTGYAFENWTENGEVVSTDNPYVFTVTGDRDLVAHFVQIFDIEGEVIPSQGGIVTGFDTYNINDTCTLVATPNEGWVFYRWEENGEEVSTDPELSFIVTENRWLTARFKNPNTIEFADPNTEAACVANWDTDGDGFLSYDEAAAVTDISWAFSGNLDINTFDELQYFTGLTSIGEGAFNCCYNLTSVVIPENVSSIDDMAFYDCIRYSGEFVIPEGVTYIGESAFGQCHRLESVIIPEGVSFINNGVFSWCFALVSVTMPEGVTYIGENAFNNCSSLASINLPSSLDFIDNGAFQGCSSLTSIVFPGNLQDIGGVAFQGCTGLTSVSFPETLITIGAQAFGGCSGLRGELTLPESLESVGGYAFYGCDEITTVNYNATNCTEMGDAQSPVFYDCASLAHINIGENVQSIPNYAFKRCSTVEDINSAAVVPPTIGASTFATVSRSIPVSVPYGSGEAYRTAPYWEEFFNITEDYSPSQYTCHWSANPNYFESNMSVIGIIQIDGVEQATDKWEIGAFSGGECRGSQLLAYYEGADRYMVFLTLYGEAGDLLTFRLYDHELGEESTLGCESYITFEADGRLGTFGEPYPFNFTSIQVTTLPQGWTWWSGYVELGEGSLAQMEESLGENGLIIKSRNDGFVSYYDGEWYGSLNAIGNENTYLIQTAAPCVMSVADDMATPSTHPVTIATGWNWIGYPNAKAMSVATALSGIEAEDDDLLKSQEGFSVYVPNMGWVGSLHTLTPGMGLMYQSHNAADMTLVYPANARTEALEDNVTARHNHWVPTPTAYAYNMSVIAVVELDDEELQGERYELAAFADGECRGSARLTYVEAIGRHVAFLTVSGDEASELRFSLYDSEMGIVEMQDPASLQYETNAVVGSIGEPYVVRFRSVTGVDEWANSVNIFPNPVNRGERFSLGMTTVETLRATSVQIINAMGVVVETWRAASLQTITAPNEAGVYTLRIAVEGKGTCHKKLVVR